MASQGGNETNNNLGEDAQVITTANEGDIKKEIVLQPHNSDQLKVDDIPFSAYKVVASPVNGGQSSDFTMAWKLVGFEIMEFFGKGEE